MYTGLYPSWGDPDDPLTFQGYLGAISVRRYPEATYPGILDTLNTLPMAYRSVIRYLPLDTADAVGEIYKYRRKWLGASKRTSTLLAERVSARHSMLVEQAPQKYMEEASEAQSQVEHGQVSFGYTSSTIILWDKDFDQLGRKVKEVEASLNTVGCIAKVEDVNAFAAAGARFLGDVYSDVRRPLLHSHNLVHLLPATAPWSGPATTRIWPAPRCCGPPGMAIRRLTSTPTMATSAWPTLRGRLACSANRPCWPRW